MNVKSTVKPMPFSWEMIDGELILRFTESPKRIITHNGEEWEYREYTLKIPCRKDPDKEIGGDLAPWLALAKQREQDALAAKWRSVRDALLAACDWTQGADTPLSEETVCAWAAYRQQLRDLPNQTQFPYDVSLPVPPGKAVRDDG